MHRRLLERRDPRRWRSCKGRAASLCGVRRLRDGLPVWRHDVRLSQGARARRAAENGARHVTENEANFRTVFIGMLAEWIARDFYPFELAQNFGTDARFLAN